MSKLSACCPSASRQFLANISCLFHPVSMIFISLLIFVCSNVVNAKNLDSAEVAKTYQQWCATISKAQGNPEPVVKFYAPHAILLPTLSDKILTNDKGGLNDYFAKFTGHKNIHCVTKKLITQVESDDIATTAGFYNFSYEGPNGKNIVVPARFTFLYKKQGSQWLIIQHHSSKVPDSH